MTIYLPPNIRVAIRDYERAIAKFESTLEGNMGNVRMVTIPTDSSGYNTKNIEVTFDRANFEIEDLDDRTQAVKIPDGIRVTADEHGLQLTTERRIQPLRISELEGVSISVKDGQIELTAEQGDKTKMFSKLNRGLLMSDLLAAFTYLQGVAHPEDSGLILANVPNMRGLHKAITSPEMLKAIL